MVGTYLLPPVASRHRIPIVHLLSVSVIQPIPITAACRAERADITLSQGHSVTSRYRMGCHSIYNTGWCTDPLYQIPQKVSECTLRAHHVRTLHILTSMANISFVTPKATAREVGTAKPATDLCWSLFRALAMACGSSTGYPGTNHSGSPPGLSLASLKWLTSMV